MKVNKEEMLGMLTAVELYLKRDHEAEWKEWERRAQVIADAATKIPSVQSEVIVPPIANHVPHLKLSWDQEKVRIAPPQVMRQLREGQPSIEASPMTNREALAFGVWMMQPGDAEVVARRVAEILKSAAA
jgi:L-seryl-tRNA(Ser) seleniumtransferase